MLTYHINTPEKSASTTITGLTALLVALSVLGAGLAHAQSITAMGSFMPAPFPTPAPGTHVATVTGALRVGTTAAQGTLTIAGGAILNASSDNAANAPAIFRNDSQMMVTGAGSTFESRNAVNVGNGVGGASGGSVGMGSLTIENGGMVIFRGVGNNPISRIGDGALAP